MAPGWRQAGPKRISRWLKIARKCFKLAQDAPQMAPIFVQNQFGLTAGYVMKRCPEKPLTTIEEGDAVFLPRTLQSLVSCIDVAKTLGLHPLNEYSGNVLIDRSGLGNQISVSFVDVDACHTLISDVNERSLLEQLGTICLNCDLFQHYSSFLIQRLLRKVLAICSGGFRKSVCKGFIVLNKPRL